MADSTSSSSKKDVNKSRRSSTTERGAIRQKLGPVTFLSNPSDLVTIIAGKGEEATEFKVHKEAVCFHSQVFRAAFNSDFVEGQTQTYRLEETSKFAAAFLVQYLYSQKLQIARLRKQDCTRSTSGKYISSPEFLEDIALAELWVLADKLRMPKLQNMALIAIEELNSLQENVSSQVFPAIYNLTASGSTLRQYYVAHCGLHLAASYYREFPEDFPHEMLQELAEFLSNRLEAAEFMALGGAKKLEAFKVSDYFVPEE